MGSHTRVRAVAVGVLGAGLLVGGVLGPSSTNAAPVVLSGCVVDPADMIGWWKGEDDLIAEVGDDLAGSAGFADGMVGRGVELGLGSTLSTSTLPVVTDGVSVEAWIKPTATQFSQAVFSRWTFVGGNDDDSYALILNPDGLIFYVDTPSLIESDTVSALTPQLFDGELHHVAATWGGGEMTLYVDGTPVATRTVRGGAISPAPSTPLHLGSTSDPGYLPYRGTIDEPAVYDRALTSAEVAAIYGSGGVGKCNPTPPNTQIGRLFDDATTAASEDLYGRAVDIAGTTTVIGVPGDDPGGSARVMTRSGTTWSPQATLVGADTDAADSFGFAVAIDGNTAVVGAFQDDAGQFINRGSVYVFVRDPNGVWTEQAKLTPSVSSNVQNFGRAVDISGDTVVVGSFNDDNPGALDSGAVYVFTRSGTTWTQQARVTASDREAGDGLGYDVAVQGDTLVAGADLGDDDVRSRSDSGAAYVFTRSGATWTEVAKLTASDSESGDEFGFAVALEGGTALIGANAANTNDTGAAYVFTGSAATWTQQAILVPPDGQHDDRFGFDVAIEGNLAVVGARLDDDPIAGVDAGSAHVFLRSGLAWSHAAKLVAGDAAADDEFGNAIAVRSGFALVGAYRDDEAGFTNRGAVYVFGT